MRYLRKNHRVSLGSVHDYVTVAGIRLGKVDSDDNLADLFTKPFEVARFVSLRSALGVVHANLIDDTPAPLIFG